MAKLYRLNSNEKISYVYNGKSENERISYNGVVLLDSVRLYFQKLFMNVDDKGLEIINDQSGENIIN